MLFLKRILANYNINHNHNHPFVNLSHYILVYILKYLDSNLDRICFALTCKKFYTERDGYLIFNCEEIPKYILDDKHSRFYLSSFRLALENSLRKKSHCTLFYCNSFYIKKLSYDYDYCKEQNQSKIADLETCFLNPNGEVDESVYKVVYDFKDKLKVCHLEDEFIEKLKKSNVKILQVGDAAPLYTSFLSSESVFIESSDLMKIGQILSLEEIIINNRVREKLEKEMFPSSLRRLTVRHYTHMHSFANFFPPHLESLIFNCSIDFDQSNQFNFPPRLHTLEIDYSWIHIAKNIITMETLPVLKTLSIYCPHRRTTIIEKGDFLHTGITNLKIKTHRFTLKKGSIPLQIRDLDLFGVQLDPEDNVFEELINLESLDCTWHNNDSIIETRRTIGVLPISLKFFHSPFGYVDCEQINRLVNLEYLYLNNQLKSLFDCSKIAKTNSTNLKRITFENKYFGGIPSLVDMPASVVQLDLNSRDAILDLNLFPPTVKKVTTNCKEFFIKNPISKFPKTVMEFQLPLMSGSNEKKFRHHYNGDKIIRRCDKDSDNFLMFYGSTILLCGIVSADFIDREIRNLEYRTSYY